MLGIALACFLELNDFRRDDASNRPPARSWCRAGRPAARGLTLWGLRYHPPCGLRAGSIFIFDTAGRQRIGLAGPSCSEGARYGRPIRQGRADRYQKVAGEYSDLAKTASSPFLRTYYRRIAEEYRVRADSELRVAERERVSMAERTEH
jgi:hypothetical protein